MSDRQADLGNFSTVEQREKSTVEFVEKGGISGGGNHAATSKEQELLTLLEKGLTIEKARQKLGIGVSRVYNLRNSLIKKGLWKKGGKNVTYQEIPRRLGARYRIHGLVITAPVRHKSEGYLRRVRRENVRMFDGTRVRLSPKFVKVNGAKELMFWGVTPDDAHAQAIEWVERFMTMLEHKLDTVLMKPGSGFELFYHEAEADNDLAGEVNARRERIIVRGDDGKVWLLTDNSFNLNEMETVGARSAGEDMESVVAPVMNDYREHAHHLRLPSTTWAMHDALAMQVVDLAIAVRVVSERQAIMEERVLSIFKLEADRMRKASDELEARMKSYEQVAPASDAAGALRSYTG